MTVNYQTEKSSQKQLPKSLRNTQDFHFNSNRSLSKPIKGVPVPDHLKTIFGIEDPKPDFVPVDPADRVIATVAMKN